MSEGSGNPTFRPHSDVWVGVSLMAIGGYGAWLASGFDALSRTYPIALSVSLIVLGALLVAKGARQRLETVPFKISGQAALFATLTLAAWIIALTSGLGYLLPTFVMQLVFLLLCGVSGYRKIILIAATITAVSYLAFIVGLGVRLPATLMPWIL
ncbi:tripartite tricarboxylate transporter TctB family protein [Pararhodobacter sp.]|uniref:tripartite tricarboxylate transporter TctB family protein n=1 Tax=Pararhodobacter sp. TaxID=2127056 RepID=UPI002AFF1520|nr:tripartite tricarboxylate transporter TctB family protein [Pararhodobacter sp.]